MDAFSLSACRSRGFFRFVYVIFTLLLVLMVSVPVQGKLPEGLARDLSSLVTLSMAKMTAAQANAAFDLNGILIVDDLKSPFTTRETSGEGYLLTRLFPKGETGTLGQGLYAYLYRVNLSELVSEAEAKPCMTQLTIPFGAVSRLDYDANSVLEDYFVISQGGAMGNRAPSLVVQDTVSGVITLTFADEVCSAYGDIPGDSTFFIGFVSTQPYKTDQSNLSLTQGGGLMQLDTRVPGVAGGTSCGFLTDPSEIPSPATINFDSLNDETAIGATYQTSYGVTFSSGIKVDALTAPVPSSTPNVAHAPYSAGGDLPTYFVFNSPVSHVGFYAGNATGKPVTATIKGYIVAAGIPETEICSTTVELPAGLLNTFVGFYDSQKRISKVAIQYPAGAGEIIDDLQFSPGNSGDRIEFPRSRIPLSGAGPKITINYSDNTRFAATFMLPEAALWMEQQEGADMRRLRFSMPGTEMNSVLMGYPDVPVFRRLIGYPEGASLSLAGVSVLASQEFLADLYPAQPSAMDHVIDQAYDDPGVFDDPPYTLDTKAYTVNAKYPEQPVSIYPVGKMRDLNLALVVVAGGQYNPVSRVITIFKEVNFEVAFTGGTGKFLPNYSSNPFEPGIERQYGTVLNASILSEYLGLPVEANSVCSEFLIFTHPNFLAAANSLAAWKISKGISTDVIQTGGSDLDTPEAIKTYIKEQYDNCAVRPSYILLFGDAEFIGSFYSFDPYLTTLDSSTDLEYALMTEGDDFPDLAYGRIPVDTQAEAQTVVDKIIAYESNPPTAASFFNTVTLAAYFECCSAMPFGFAWDSRSFVESSESARAAVIADGKTVNRIYTTNAPVSAPPAFYRNGAPLPADIGLGSGFNWSGNTIDIIAAINNGTGLIMHRDHGASNGWGDPQFSTSSLQYLQNSNLTPVIYSINCTSGLWDNELPWEIKLAEDYVSWSESMLRMNGGAVSLIGALRVSPTWANTALARGLFDATWPDTVPTFGGSIIYRRLGDILNYGKLYLFLQVYDPVNASEITYDSYQHDNRIFHVIGDPTLELWKKPPLREMSVSAVYHWGKGIGALSLQEFPELTIEYLIEGAVITLLQNGQPVGRGTVVGGQAVMTFVADFDPNTPLQVSACQDDDICVELLPPSSFVYLPFIKR